MTVIGRTKGLTCRVGMSKHGFPTSGLCQVGEALLHFRPRLFVRRRHAQEPLAWVTEFHNTVAGYLDVSQAAVEAGA